MPDTAKPSQRAPSRQNRARRVAELIPAAGGASFRRFGFAQSALVERWIDIVGANYARHSRPEGLRFPRGKRDGGALHIAVTAALAPLIRHVEPQLIERANRILGYAAVARIVLRQGDVTFEPAPAAAQEPAAVPAEARSTLREVADADLRASLESLARALATAKGPPVVR